MKIKMVSYYANSKPQIFATFEYQKIKFDVFKNLEDLSPHWNFLEDEAFLKLRKIANTELILKNCIPKLYLLDSSLN